MTKGGSKNKHHGRVLIPAGNKIGQAQSLDFCERKHRIDGTVALPESCLPGILIVHPEVMLCFQRCLTFKGMYYCNTVTWKHYSSASPGFIIHVRLSSFVPHERKDVHFFLENYMNFSTAILHVLSNICFCTIDNCTYWLNMEVYLAFSSKSCCLLVICHILNPIPVILPEECIFCLGFCVFFSGSCLIYVSTSHHTTTFRWRPIPKLRGPASVKPMYA